MTVKHDAEYVSVPVTEEALPLTTPKSAPPVTSKASSSSSLFSSVSLFDWQAILFLLLALTLVAYQNDWPSGPGLLSSAPSCKGLLVDGKWVASGKSAFQTWQPSGCYKYTYTSKDSLGACFTKYKEVLVVGDSTARALFLQFAKLVDPNWSLPETGKASHDDLAVTSQMDALRLRFQWDPFLNRTFPELPSATTKNKVDLLVVRAGYWYLKHAPDSAQLQFQKMIQRIAERQTHAFAERTYFGLLPPVVEERLHVSRKNVTNKGVTALNGLIWSLLGPSSALLESGHADYATRYPGLYVPVSTYRLYAEAPHAASDGIHYESKVVAQESDILLNHACNQKLHAADVLPKGTCCNQYRRLSWKQYLTIGALLSSGVLCFAFGFVKQEGVTRLLPKRETANALLTLGLVLAYVVLADRVGFFVKTAKTWHTPTFVVLMLLLFVAGAATWKKNTSGSGFLNREQTDEWKGWMQVIILVYHFTGASSVMAIYNLIRIMVASYLFMTGYGHFTYFYKKGDFSLHRSLAVLLRLNLLTVLLTMTTNLDYLSYYFSPLTSLWYGIVWGTMRIKPEWKGKWCLLKLGLSTLVITLLVTWELPTRLAVQGCNTLLGSQWNAREWLFRVALDKWIVFYGMFIAYLYIHYDDLLAAPAQKAPALFSMPSVQLFSLTSLATAYFYYSSFGFQSKFHYNAYHPFLSLLTVTLFIVGRNLTQTLRNGHSTFFAFFGRCSLETFILQYHIFLSMDTRGILMIIPDADLLGWSLNFIITTVIFVWLSDKAAKATNVLCGALLGPKPKGDASERWQPWHLLLVSGAVALWNHLPE